LTDNQWRQQDANGTFSDRVKGLGQRNPAEIDIDGAGDRLIRVCWHLPQSMRPKLLRRCQKFDGGIPKKPSVVETFHALYESIGLFIRRGHRRTPTSGR
jgi:hypothetical protein